MDFLFEVKKMLDIILILLGYIIIPSFDTMNPSNLPSMSAKNDFFQFNEIAYL